MLIPSDWEPQSPRNGKGFVPSSPFPKWIFSVHSQRLHIHLLPSAVWACPSEQGFSPHRLYHMMWDLDTWSQTLFTLLLKREAHSPEAAAALFLCLPACLPACRSFRDFGDIFPLGRSQGLVVILQSVSKEAQHCCLLSLSFLTPQWIMGD